MNNNNSRHDSGNQRISKEIRDIVEVMITVGKTLKGYILDGFKGIKNVVWESNSQVLDDTKDLKERIKSLRAENAQVEKRLSAQVLQLSKELEASTTMMLTYLAALSKGEKVIAPVPPIQKAPVPPAPNPVPKRKIEKSYPAKKGAEKKTDLQRANDF